MHQAIPSPFRLSHRLERSRSAASPRRSSPGHDQPHQTAAARGRSPVSTWRLHRPTQLTWAMHDSRQPLHLPPRSPTKKRHAAPCAVPACTHEKPPHDCRSGHIRSSTARGTATGWAHIPYLGHRWGVGRRERCRGSSRRWSCMAAQAKSRHQLSVRGSTCSGFCRARVISSTTPYRLRGGHHSVALPLSGLLQVSVHAGKEQL